METLTHATRLQQKVLSWDYFQLYRFSGEDRPATAAELPEVPETFGSVEEYLDTFTPLVLEECAAQALREEEGEKGMATQAVVASSEQTGAFLSARLLMAAENSSNYVDNDLIILSKDDPDMGWDSVRPEFHCLGVVEGSEGTGIVRVKFYLSNESQQGNPHGLARVRGMHSRIETPQSCWFMKKLANLATITREWVALQSIRKLPFLQDLLTAKQGRKNAHSLMIPTDMEAEMQKTYNESQMAAIRSGLDGSAINLVQGPPGTGKTKTILGILSIIMHSVPPDAMDMFSQMSHTAATVEPQEANRLWLKLSSYVFGPPNPRDAHPRLADFAFEGAPNGDTSFGLDAIAVPRKVGQQVVRKNHVLVCAPSNSALDEIVLRVMNTGLMDKDGRMYTPSIVRVGVNIHHSVSSVGLDALVSHRLSATGKSGGVKSRTEMDRMRLAILDEADIVASTLAFSGSGLFARMRRAFDVVVIDEAAQAVEPSTFIPLVNGCQQVFLIGDPIQLPATVISQYACDLGYDVSLFKRMQRAGYPVTMLDTQYRMHPQIATFPSAQFYNSSLKNGPNVVDETKRDWHSFPCFGPFAFFDVDGRETVPEGSTSLINEQEAELVLSICGELMQRWPHLRTTTAMAVISPYKSQVKLLKERFSAALGPETAKMVDINTIDGFQGREKDVAVFSAVRAKGRRAGSGIGFVADERRVNVGLTRARASMLVVGNARTLQHDENWGSLIRSARERGCMFKATTPYRDFIGKAISGEAKPLEPLPPAKAAAPVDLQGYDDFDYSDTESPDVPAGTPARGKRGPGARRAPPKAKRAKGQ